MTVFSTLSVLIAGVFVGAQAIESQEFVLQAVMGCEAPTTHDYPIVWAPGQCQVTPGDVAASTILDCRNGGLRVRGYDGNTCQGQMRTDYTMHHDTVMGTRYFKGEFVENTTCLKFLIPETIREACKPEQPDGPELVLKELTASGSSCHSYAVQSHPIIWAPGQCQATPGDAEASTILQCKDGGLQILGYNGNSCQGEARTDFVVHQMERVESRFYQGQTVVSEKCLKFQIPEVIRNECALPEEPDQPVGPELVIKELTSTAISGDCHSFSVNSFPIVWAPGQCQATPGDAEASTILQCKDGGLQILGYNGNSCQGELRTDYVIHHMERIESRFYQGQTVVSEKCLKFQIPDVIRNECALPEEPEQPVGPQLVIKELTSTAISGDCHSFSVNNFPIVWAPGQCQSTPGDAQSSTILQCKDGGLQVLGYNGNACEGEPRTDYVMHHMVRQGPRFFQGAMVESEKCLQFQIPQVIRDECALPEVTEAPPQPGNGLVLKQLTGCIDDAVPDVQEFPVVWAPGQCQPTPGDAEASTILECSEGGLRVIGYNGSSCQGVPRTDYVMHHDTLMGSMFFQGQTVENTSCMRFLIPDVIRDACEHGLPAPVSCLGTELLRQRPHKRLCRTFNDNPSACEAAGCKHRAERRPHRRCKPKRVEELSCSAVSTEHCCSFEGCQVDNGACAGSFAGW